MAHHHKVDFLVKRLDCSFGQGQGHRKGSEFQRMFIWMISPLLLNLLQPKLVWWCSITGQSVMQEDWFAVLKFRATVRAHLIRHDCFYLICWTADLLLQNLEGTLSSATVVCVRIRLLFSSLRSQRRFKSLLNLYVSYIFCTTDFLATKLGVLIYY